MNTRFSKIGLAAVAMVGFASAVQAQSINNLQQQLDQVKSEIAGLTADTSNLTQVIEQSKSAMVSFQRTMQRAVDEPSFNEARRRYVAAFRRHEFASRRFASYHATLNQKNQFARQLAAQIKSKEQNQITQGGNATR